MKKTRRKRLTRIAAIIAVLAAVIIPTINVYAYGHGSHPTGNIYRDMYSEWYGYYTDNKEWGISPSNVARIDLSTNDKYYVNIKNDFANYNAAVNLNWNARTDSSQKAFQRAFYWGGTGKLADGSPNKWLSRVAYMKLFKIPDTITDARNMSASFYSNYSDSSNTKVTVYMVEFDKNFNYISDSDWFTTNNNTIKISDKNTKYVMFVFKNYVNSGSTEEGSDSKKDFNLKSVTDYNTYISWQSIPVTFDQNGGTGGQTGTLYERYGCGWYSNSAATTLKNSVSVPTKAGYTFGGYKAKTSGVLVFDKNGKIINSDAARTAIGKDDTKQLVAVWNPIDYTITLDNQNATSKGTASIIEHFGSYYTLDGTSAKKMSTSTNPISVPEKKYTITYNGNGGTAGKTSDTSKYVFGGYYTSASGQGTQKINSSGYLTGNAKPDDYKAKATWYAKWTSSSVTLPKATRTGYVFKGWSTSKTATTGVTSSYTPTADVTLYAIWTPVTYSIKYNKGLTNSTAAVPNDTSCTYNTDVTLASKGSLLGTSYTISFDSNGGSSVSSKTGRLSFSSWKIGNNTYNSGQKLTKPNFVTSDKGSVTATAQWSSATISDFSTPVRSGYKFDGWYTAASGGTKVTSITVKPSETAYNATLYAHWTPIQYKVVLNPNKPLNSPYDVISSAPAGWTASNNCFSLNFKYNDSNTLPSVSSVYSVKGYDVAGWYTAASGGTNNGSGNKIWNLSSTNNATINLYPHWTIKKYSITYNLNGGTVSGELKTSYTVEDNKIVLPQPKREGYKFDGWTGTNGTVPQVNITINSGSTGNRVYTANWTAIPPIFIDGDKEIKDDEDVSTKEMYQGYIGDISSLMDVIKNDYHISAQDYQGNNLTTKMELVDAGGFDPDVENDYFIKIKVSDQWNHSTMLTVKIHVYPVYPMLQANPIVYVEGQYFYQNAESSEIEDSTTALPPMPIYAVKGHNNLLDDILAYAKSVGYIIRNNNKENVLDNLSWDGVISSDISVTKIVYKDRTGKIVDTITNPVTLRTDVVGIHTVTLSVTNKYDNTTVIDIPVTFTENDDPLLSGPERYAYINEKIGIEDIIKKIDIEDVIGNPKISELKIFVDEERVYYRDHEGQTEGDSYTLDTKNDHDYTITIKYRDEYGKEQQYKYTLHISGLAASTKMHTRFISSRYIDTLGKDSVWRTNTVLNQRLKNTLEKNTEDINAKDESGNYVNVLSVWTFTSDQIKEIKKNISDEVPSKNRNLEFLSKYGDNCIQSH